MPIVSKLFKKNNSDNNSNVDVSELDSNDIEINDFSENVDLDGLGDLLSGDIPVNENLPEKQNSPDQEDKVSLKTKKPKKSLNIGKKIKELFSRIAGKLKNKKSSSDIPELSKENPSDDPNYVSDTVSFVDYSVDPGSSDGALEGDLPQNSAYNEEDSTEDNFNIQVTQPVSSHENNMYIPQNTVNGPVNYNVYGTAEDNLPSSTRGTEQVFQGDDSSGDIELDFDDYPTHTSTDAADESNVPDETQQRKIEEEATYQPRRHDIMGAFRARIQSFCKRLPSFKPREYTIPEPTYEPQDDHIKSPSLIGDIEKIIEERSDLGEITREYEEMREYIRSVNENITLSRNEIALPENINEVYAVQNELLDMINQIGIQNEQQRRKIGVYEKPKEEDPYNYRGINDNRQNYSDMESSSFSMMTGINFESEEKVSPNRAELEQQYNEQMYSTQFEDDFDSDDVYVPEDNSPDGNADDFDLGDFASEDSGDNQQYDDNWSDDLDLDDSFDETPRRKFWHKSQRHSNVDYQ